MTKPPNILGKPSLGDTPRNRFISSRSRARVSIRFSVSCMRTAYARSGVGASARRAREPFMPFTATVLTMFPEAFPGPLGVSLIGTAWREEDLWRLETVDIRAFSKDKRGFLDDTPAGGGRSEERRA